MGDNLNKIQVFALKCPSNNDYDRETLKKVRDFLTNSIRNGVSRFSWSYIDTADLRKLNDKRQEEISETERECLEGSHFLLEVNVGWIVHINLPERSRCCW